MKTESEVSREANEQQPAHIRSDEIGAVPSQATAAQERVKKVPLTSTDFHEFVGIGAGELGMMPCELCGALERDLVHAEKFRVTTTQEAVAEVDVLLRSLIPRLCEYCRPPKSEKYPVQQWGTLENNNLSFSHNNTYDYTPCGAWAIRDLLARRTSRSPEANTNQEAGSTVESDSRNTPWPVCPITRRPFFMNLDHPNMGEVPTFGGPFDSYTIPEADDDGELRCERYDHDDGNWIEGGEPTGLWILRGQPASTAEAVAESRDDIEKALEELREMFPDAKVRRTINNTDGHYKVYASLIGRMLAAGEGATLSEAMDAVREWRDTSKETDIDRKQAGDY